MVSVPYRLQSRMPTDFDLVAHGNESTAALAQLEAPSPGDIVVYDRGYFSYELLHEHVVLGLNRVFRVEKKAGTALDTFIASGRADTIVTVRPSRETVQKLRRRYRQTTVPRSVYAWSSTRPATPSSPSRPR